jgi:hypothetical protein
MKTAKEIVENDGLTEHDQCEGYVLKVQDIVDYMEQYAELYHDSEVKKLNTPAVMQRSELFKKRCSNCGVDELFTKDDYCNCCGSKQVSFFK